MEYIPVYADDNSGDKDSAGTVQVDAVVTQTIGVRTTAARRTSISRTIRAVARVALARLKLEALDDAALGADAVEVISAFGAGTVEHDRSEARGIRVALGERGGEIPTVVTKGSIGNNGAGAGAIDLGIGALCVERGLLPPARNYKKADPECGLNVVAGQPVETSSEVLLSVAYALGGGQNAALVLKRMEA